MKNLPVEINNLGLGRSYSKSSACSKSIRICVQIPSISIKKQARLVMYSIISRPKVTEAG